jgi:hypothetical protein
MIRIFPNIFGIVYPNTSPYLDVCIKSTITYIMTTDHVTTMYQKDVAENRPKYHWVN